jgi:putative transposase
MAKMQKSMVTAREEIYTARITMSDHVHIFVRSQPTIAPNRIAAVLKGYTSRILRQEFSELKSKLPTLWSRSYFVSTHGHVSTDTVESSKQDHRF